MLGNRMHRQVFLLASAQALFQTVSVLVMTVGGLAGAQITPRPELATMPIAAMFLGTALMTFPASHLMARFRPKGGISAWGGAWHRRGRHRGRRDLALAAIPAVVRDHAGRKLPGLRAILQICGQ